MVFSSRNCLFELSRNGKEKIIGRIGIGVRTRTGFRIDLSHRGAHRFRVRSKIRIWIGVMYPRGRPELEMALYEV